MIAQHSTHLGSGCGHGQSTSIQVYSSTFVVAPRALQISTVIDSGFRSARHAPYHRLIAFVRLSPSTIYPRQSYTLWLSHRVLFHEQETAMDHPLTMILSAPCVYEVFLRF
ncbi:hypothetical protein SMACR_12711 [Sordaria macrospora]|uniref:Uncharacterized protein n=1 Tax=Sordaria macrospora TaxID=5147 RepID=A0A8S8ZH29_SORMA|nr:hypothetical protein SMACR_12711 [Sordaria macrospora]WPJ59091.1 hypothetical protein SMAC4_12711 [Sordaria macrospora]